MLQLISFLKIMLDANLLRSISYVFVYIRRKSTDYKEE